MSSDKLGIDLLDTVEGDQRDNEHRLYADFMRTMYVMFKCSFVYQVNNDALRAACDRVAGVANRIRARVDDIASLELLAEGTYVNRALIKLDASTYDQADYLFAICNTLNVSAIAAIGDTTADDWLDLIAAFKRCVGPGGSLDEFAKLELRNLRITATAGHATERSHLAVTDRFRALRAYATTVIAIGEMLEAARMARPLRTARVKRPLQDLVLLAKTCAPLLLGLAHLKRHKIRVQHHLANSAVLAICSARPLALPRSVICEIGLQAALHDVGRAFAATGSDSGTLAERPAALQGIRKLIRTGALGKRTIARVVVVNEVRRWFDRDAEPPGDTPYRHDLAKSTRLIAVAHAYSLLTTPLRQRPALLPDEALRVIALDAGRRFDATAVKLLVNTLGIFPIGSTVELSDGRLAIVIEAPHEIAGPARPKIKVVRELDGTITDGAIYDLGGVTGAHLRILRCIDGEEQAINAPAFLLS